MTSRLQRLWSVLDASSPVGHQSLRFSLIRQHVPRTAPVLERPGAQRCQAQAQVQSLRHLPEPGGEVAVVDVPVSIRVELVEQSFDVSFSHAELKAHRRKILVFDLAGFVHVAGGKQPPQVGSFSVHRLGTAQERDVTLNSVPHETCSERRSDRRCTRGSTETPIGPDPSVGGVRHAYGPNERFRSRSVSSGCCRSFWLLFRSSVTGHTPENTPFCLSSGCVFKVLFVTPLG